MRHLSPITQHPSPITHHLILLCLITSCSNGTPTSIATSISPEEEAAVEAAREGLLGDMGGEIIERQAEYEAFITHTDEVHRLLKQEADEAKTAAEVEKTTQKLVEVNKALTDYELQWKQWHTAFAAEVLTKQVASEVAAGAPLKIVVPFAVKSFSANGIEFAATVELTAPRPGLTLPSSPFFGQDKFYIPTVVAVDANGHALTDPVFVRCKPIERYGDYLDNGTQAELTCSFANSSEAGGPRLRDKALAAKKLVIQWEHPTDQ